MTTLTPVTQPLSVSSLSPTETQAPQRPDIRQMDTLSPVEIDPITTLVQETVSVRQDKLVFKQMDIPLFDLDEVSAASGEGRKELIQGFGDALRDVGFLAIKAERLTPLVKQMFAETEAYFHQSQEVKMRNWEENNGSGYSQTGRETAAGAKHADLKEFYHIPPNYEKWPTNRPEFAPVMQKYHAELSVCIRQSLSFLAEYLNEPTEDIDISMQSEGNLLRLIYYPVHKETDPVEAMGAAAHEDLNALTALPPATAPGLQLLNKEGEWVDVVAPEGYLIINTGEQVEMKTAGYIKAIRHRVINPGGQWTDKERFAAVYFGSWSRQYSLKPFDGCIEKACAGMTSEEREAHLQKYPDVTAMDNLISRLIEMGTIKDPGRELVESLRTKGLLRLPTAALKETYPDLLGDEKKSLI